MRSEIDLALRDGRFCSLYSTIGRSIVSASQVLLWIGSPFGALSDFTTCLMYSTYLFTVLGVKPLAHIFSTSGLTARLSASESGRSPIAGKKGHQAGNYHHASHPQQDSLRITTKGHLSLRHLLQLPGFVQLELVYVDVKKHDGTP